MNVLKIEIPKGFEIENFDSKTGTVSFRPVKKLVIERIKIFDDVLSETDIDEKDFISECEGLEPDEIAYKKIKLIVKALNEGWTPDWSNSSEYKYYPWFTLGSPSGSGFSYYDYDVWDTGSDVGSRLAFKTRELAVYAGKQFEAIYKEYFV